MRYFFDSERFRWEIRLNLNTVKRVYDELKIDLLQPAKYDETGKTLAQRLLDEDLLLGEVVVALISDQIAAQNKTANEVRESINAEQFTQIQEAFFAEYADFFEARKKKFLADAIAKDYKIMKAKIAEWDATLLSGSVGAESSVPPPSPESAPISAT